MKDINFNSQIFEELREQINTAIQLCLHKTEVGNFDSGDISIKINVKLLDHVENFKNEYGEEYPYEYKTPVFEYAVTTNLKEAHKLSGMFIENDSELVREDDGHFSLKPIEKAQISIFD